MCRKLILLASFLLVFGLSETVAQVQENQIVNGEFDDGFDPWGIYTYQNTTEGFTVKVVGNAGISGRNAAMFDITNSPELASIGIAQSGMIIEPGVKYPIGFTAKAEQDRGLVVLLQANINNASWPTYLTETVELTTTPQNYVIEYTHSGEIIGDDDNESLNLYFMIKGPWWHPPGENLNGKVWIDRVFFGAEPPRQLVEIATNPKPPDGTVNEETWANLSWQPGDFAVSHDVYFGDNFDDVSTGDQSTFQGNQAATFFVAGFPGFAYPDGLVPGTTYFWRVDEVNDAEPNSPWTGDVWNFTVPPRIAYNPEPVDGVKFVDPNVQLSWTAGFGAKLHTVYFGENFDDVNSAAGGLPDVSTTYEPGALELEKTYYWRIDEFDGAATLKGDVWSFTIRKAGGGLKAEYFNNRSLSGEPMLIRTDAEIDFYWGNADVRGENSPDASINVNNFSARWSGELEADLTDTYIFQISANNGFRLWLDERPIIEFWDNGTTSSRQSEPVELLGGETYSIRMEYFEGEDTAMAQLFWESSTREMQIIPQAALSLPVKANRANPDNGAVNVKQMQILSWSPGDNAASHQVYFGTDEEAVRNANTSSPEYKGSRALGSERYDPGKLAWDTTYYWRVDEVNDANPDSPWPGILWSFTTADFLIIDDFEAYNDLDPTDPESNRIFMAWLDGFDNPATNGSVVGYANPPFAEQTIVHSGNQSMPMTYDNAVGKSEATLTLTDIRNWTENGVDTLAIWYYGDAANAPETMYVVLDGTSGVDNPNPNAAQVEEWTEWRISLQQFNVSLANVNTITLGFGNRSNPVAGGSGLMYFDDIRLYAPEQVSP